MKIYHRTGTRLINIGICGPTQAVELPTDEARRLAEGPDWSLTPFGQDQKEPTAETQKNNEGGA